MVTTNGRTLTTGAHHRSGLLGEWVEQDMAEVLNDFGQETDGQQAQQVPAEPRVAFAYGIPMAGVRYYGFVPEG